ncbi:MAG TPA: aromatic ring-hydroxylating dioxygenase subunit alpha [Dictyobacter sp.]|jgi:phenylpropionate dioxygenase-like ring-hydroxylating dioxygenase large terminal subunit|nr:aromatic ring-hydroxylating dioxygenase subunit alpha [Dictyobacter sp.]
MLKDQILCNDWLAVAQSTDIAENAPTGVRLLDEEVVLWRVGDKICAWRDLCAHRGTRLSLGKIQQNTLTCPYHGWVYDDDGQCIKYPAHPNQKPSEKAHATVYKAQQKYGLIWVCLGEPAHDIPAFAQWDDPAFRKVCCGPYHYNASAPRAIENFLDVAHFPFVHQSYLGDPAHADINDYDVETSDDGIIARDISVWQPDPDGTGKGASVSYTYQVQRPLTASFVKSSSGPRFAMFFTICPVTMNTSIAWSYVAMDYGNLADEEIRNFQDIITSQDIPVVESQRPELLPLDLQAEIHLRSDRTAIAYRKWLKELGLTFGTA